MMDKYRYLTESRKKMCIVVIAFEILLLCYLDTILQLYIYRHVILFVPTYPSATYILILNYFI